jgi:hypothetical protein
MQDSSTLPIVGAIVLAILGWILITYKAKDRHVIRLVFGIAALVAGVIWFLNMTVGWDSFLLGLAWVLDTVGSFLVWLGQQAVAGANGLRQAVGQ